LSFNPRELIGSASGAQQADEELPRMGFFQHLEELRRRLIVSLLAVFLGFLSCWYFAPRIFAFLSEPIHRVLPPGQRLAYTTLTEPFLMYFRVALLAGAILAAPVVLWQVWLFISPALYRREKSGDGAHIDMALFDTQVAMLANQASNALISGKDPPRQGNTHPNIVPYQPFDAADQPIIIAVGNDRQFARLAQICGHPEWTSDERFSSNAARVANRETMVALVAETIRQKPAAEWLDQLEVAGIPAGPINRITQALNDVQAQHRQMVRNIAGVPLVGSPIRINQERADSDLPPPALGEHTNEVLAGLVSDDELASLRSSGVIG